MESLQLKPGEVIYKCPKCCCIKPERAHHCSICKRCIRKMDHHCPWVNNCVGEKNQRFFVLFTMYIALSSVHALILCGLQFISCVRGQWTECSDFSPPITVILLIFLCLEGLLFFTFTAVMFGTQIHSICNDETEIERLKSEKPTWERRLRWEGMKSVFGGPPSLLWMNPFVGFRFRRLQTRPRKGGPEFSVWGPCHRAGTCEWTLSYLFGVWKGINSSSVTNRANGTYTNQLLAASSVLYKFTVTDCKFSKLVTGGWCCHQFSPVQLTRGMWPHEEAKCHYLPAQLRFLLRVLCIF